jgi:crossover junction endodeoxyribonuclease RusA
MPGLEFVVRGTPISTGASGKSKAKWRAKVSAAATAALGVDHGVVADAVRATVVYFYVDTDLDLDNILKPILDAMNGLVYVDDFQVANIVAAKRDVAGSYVLTDASPVVVEQLAAAEGGDFVFVAIDLLPLISSQWRH